MNPVKRRILYKLTSLRSLQGDRTFSKLSVDAPIYTVEEVQLFKAQVSDITEVSERILKVTPSIQYFLRSEI